MPAPKTVPLYGEARLRQRVAETFCPDIGKDIVLGAMTLKNWQPSSFSHKRHPDRPCKQVAGELHQPRKWIVGLQNGITDRKSTRLNSST